MRRTVPDALAVAAALVLWYFQTGLGGVIALVAVSLTFGLLLYLFFMGFYFLGTRLLKDGSMLAFAVLRASLPLYFLVAVAGLPWLLALYVIFFCGLGLATALSSRRGFREL